MAQNPPPSDPEVAGRLHTLGVVSLCQWDVLVFLYRHQSTLLGAADLARLLGYPSDSIVVALDVHFVSSVPVGADLVPAQPRATTRVAPTLRLAMDL
jgi:hypothetical protein